MEDRKICENCRDRELNQLREDLQKCRKNTQTKDKQLKVLNKRIFICTIIGVAIAAIFGKEALDALTEWIGSIKGFRSSVLESAAYPSPGALGLFAVAFITSGTRKRKQ